VSVSGASETSLVGRNRDDGIAGERSWSTESRPSVVGEVVGDVTVIALSSVGVEDATAKGVVGRASAPGV
jgi:hypothetical protein